jgi:hypothetical protein
MPMPIGLPPVTKPPITPKTTAPIMAVVTVTRLGLSSAMAISFNKYTNCICLVAIDA